MKAGDDAFNKVRRDGDQAADTVGKSFAQRVKDAFKNLGGNLFDVNQITQGIQTAANSLDQFTQPFVELDKNVKNIGTLGVENFEEFASLATDLSKTVPDSAAAIANGVYQAISAGVTGTNQQIIDFTEVASKTAVAGLASTEDAVNGLTSVLNAYKLQSTDASKVSDTFFAAIKLGKTSFNELNGALANVIPAASAAGVQFDEIAANIAQMTALGVPTSQASTQLRAALIELQKPGADLAKVMKGVTVEIGGVKQKLTASNIGQVLKQQGLTKTLQDIQQAAEKSGKSMTQVFSSSEAASAALLLTGENAARATETIAKVQSEIQGGAASKAYEVAADSIDVKTKILANKVQAVFNSVFQTLGSGAVTALNAVTSIGPALSGVASIIPLVSGSFETLWTAITGPVGLTIAAIAAVGAALYILYNNVQPVKDVIDDIIDFVLRFADAVSPVFEELGATVVEYGKLLYEFWITPLELVWDAVSGLISLVVKWLSSGKKAGNQAKETGGFFETLGKVVQRVVAFFRGLRESIETARVKLEGIRAGVEAFVSAAIDNFSDLFTLDFDGFVSKITSAFRDASNKVEREASDRKLKDAAISRVSGTIDSFVSGFQKDLTILADKFGAGTEAFDKQVAAILRKRKSDFIGLAAGNGLENEDLTKATDELQKRFDEALSSVQKKVEENPPPPAKVPVKITTEILDFADEVTKAVQETQKIRGEISAKSIADDLQRERAAAAEKRRIAEQGIAGEIDAIDKKLTAAKEKAAKGGDDAQTKLVVKNYEEALAALRDKGAALIEQINAEEIEAIRKVATAQAEALLEKNASLLQLEIDAVQARADAVTGADLAAIEKRGQLRLDLLRKQQQLEIQQALAADQDFKEFAAEVQTLVDEGTISISERDRLLSDFSARRLAQTQGTLTTLGLLQAKHNQQTVAAEKTTQAEILEEERKGNLAYQAGLALRASFAQAFFNSYDRDREESLNKELADLSGQQQEAWTDYLAGKISNYRDYADQVGDIDDQIAAKQQELADTQLDTWQRTLVAIRAVFEELEKRQQDLLDKRLATLGDSIGKSLDAITKSTADGFDKLKGIDWTEVTDGLVDASKAAAGVVVSVWGQMAASGKATLGDFADAALITTIQSVRSIVEGNIVGIVSAAFAINPFLGIASIPAVLVVEALLSKWESDARGRIGKHGFWTGGYTGDGGKYEYAGPAHRGEFIFDQETTRAWRPFFEAIHARKVSSPRELGQMVITTKGQLQHSSMTIAGVDGLRDEMRGVRKQVAQMEKVFRAEYSDHRSMELDLTVKADHSGFYAEQERRRRKAATR